MGFSRKQFTFYRSYIEAAAPLTAKQRGEYLEALVNYALEEIEPVGLSKAARTSFEVVRPFLDRARVKAMSGKMGGSASGESRSKTEAKPKQNEANVKQGEVKGKDKDEVKGEGEEQGQILPQETTTEGFPEVLMTLRVCGIELIGQEGAECERLCAQYGKQAILDAIDRAKEANVPRWSYIRAIVNSGGVGKRVGGVSRRVMETNAQCQKHDAIDPCMVKYARQMLEEDLGEYDQMMEEGGQT